MLIKTAARTALAICTALLGCGIFGCAPSKEMHSETYYDMFDTFVTVIAYEDDSDRFDDNCKQVKDTLYECSRLFDIYREYEGMNNLASVNKNAGVSPVKVDEKIISLIEFSIRMYEKTDGSVNIAMGSVLKLWHECREKNTEQSGSAPLPTQAELSKAAEHSDITDIVVDRENMTVYLADGEMSLDVGAVAKGYAADIAANALKDTGVTDGYAINIGGNVITIGQKTENTPWRVSVQSPYEQYNTHLTTVELNGTSLVTSGTYERKFVYDGKEYHHIINPDTLYPSEHFDSVSVLGENSAVCDALTTALFNMPLEQGKALVEATEGVEAMWAADKNITRSSGFPSDAK